MLRIFMRPSVNDRPAASKKSTTPNATPFSSRTITCDSARSGILESPGPVTMGSTRESPSPCECHRGERHGKTAGRLFPGVANLRIGPQRHPAVLVADLPGLHHIDVPNRDAGGGEGQRSGRRLQPDLEHGLTQLLRIGITPRRLQGLKHDGRGLVGGSLMFLGTCPGLGLERADESLV